LFSNLFAPGASFAGQADSKEATLSGDIPLNISHYDRAEYDPNTGLITATGNNVRAQYKDDFFEFREGIFNTKDNTGEIHDGQLFFKENSLHIRGDLIQKSAEDTYKIKGFSLTTCDTDTSSWSITGSEINVVKEGYGGIKNAAFRIRGVPVFYLPYMIFPAKTKRQTGLLLPQFGYSSLNGAGIEIPFFWAISDQTDATFYERYMSHRGLMQGLEFRYIASRESKGEFLFDNLLDKIRVKDLTELDQARISPFERTNRDRYWLRGMLNHDLSSDVTVRMDLDFVSDQDYLREFEREFVGIEERPDLSTDFLRPLEERYSSFRRSALRVSRDSEDYSLQASGYYYQMFDDDTGSVDYQPLTGIFYSLLPTRLLKLPVFFNATTDYNYTHNDTGVEGHNLSINPKLSYPQQLGNYLKMNTNLSYTSNLETYNEHSGAQESIVRNAYQASLSLSTVLERIFEVNSNNVKRLKHKITPGLIYEYGKFSNIPVNQNQYENPWYDPVVPGSRINRIGLSVENLLDAALSNEKGEVSYSQWAQLDITQRYDIEELQRRDLAEGDKKPWEPFLVSLILRPLKDVSFRADTAWDHYKNKISTAVLSFNVTDRKSEDWTNRYYIDYAKNVGSDDSLNLRVETTLYDGFSAGVLIRRNLNLHYDINDSFWLQYQAHCWSLRLGTELEKADRKLIFKFLLTGF
jgi:LPS-assembly protein